MTTALYRRYRPETFEDVIGQSHVTEPLMTALRKNKVNHAYLFSGPRGCGKTTSARILARCLNCAQGPTPTPCGQCESCRDLARDGAGSLDVIEMDAASHGGVDDARQLRERATFAPVRDRYKIFIIDEAHMVTRDGFNALLKIVEEPPEHIKFIFATTEPNKVLATIRSRTHHYPFRLVPPEPLMDYLNTLCQQEGVGVEPGVQAMVVRAGGGSVRDSLSVLDQLMAGTDDDQIGYDLASSLLGYTHGALLDDVVDAFGSGDAATVFRAVDRVIQTGQDPRRFVEDLLERFRDLVIVDAVPESAGNILHGTPEDQITRLRNQAHSLGAAELSRSADITNEALTEMVGATSPQLHLELLCARLLLPSAENTTRGVGVRVDRLERRLNIGRTGAPTGPLLDIPEQQAQDGAAAPAQPASEQVPPAPAASAEQSVHDEQAGHDDGAAEPPRQDQAAPAAPESEHQSGGQDSQGPAEDLDPLTAAEGGFGKFRGRQPGQPSQPRETGGESAAHQPADHAQHQPEQRQPAPERRTQDQGGPSQRGPVPPASVPRASVTPDQTPERPPRADESAAQGPASGGEIDMIRNSWTEVLAALADIHRVSWMTAMRGTPVAFDGSVLQLRFDAEGDRKNFPRFEANLVQAIQQVIGVSCRVEAVSPDDGPRGDTSGGPRGGGPRDTGPRGAGPRDAGPGGPWPRDGGSRPGGPHDGGSRPAGYGQGAPQRSQRDDGFGRGMSGDGWSGQGQPDRGDPQGSWDQGSEREDRTHGADSDPSGSAQSAQRPRGGAPDDGGGASRESSQHHGGRATGPRPFPAPSQEQDQGSESASASASFSSQGPAQDDAAEVTSWAVASIPDSDPFAAAPTGPDAPGQSAGAPASASADDPAATSSTPASAPAPTSASASSPTSASASAPTSGRAAAPSSDQAEPALGTADDDPPLSTAHTRSAWDQVAQAPQQPQEDPADGHVAADGRTSPTEPAGPSAPAEPAVPDRSDADREPGDERRPARQQRRGAAPRRRGEDPSPDPVVPASPYDDIPWPDEAPPEDEPPFEDPAYRSAPSRSAAAAQAAPPSAESAPDEPARAEASPARDAVTPQERPSRAPASPAPSSPAPDQTPDRGADPGADRASAPAPQEPATSSETEQAETAQSEEAPPEQWRPSAPASASASATPAAPRTGTPPPSAGTPRKQSFRERHAAHFAAAQQEQAPRTDPSPAADLDSEATFSPSEDDEAVENTDQSTRALIERILGGRLVEEIPHQSGV